MDRHHLQKHIAENFNAFQNRVLAHKNEEYTYSWLYNKTANIPFQPDYLQLHQYGASPLKTFANKHLIHSSFLWQTIAWPHIKNAVLSKIHHHYLPLLFSQTNQPSSDHHSACMTAMTAILEKPFPTIYNSTFTDLYYFLNDCLYTFAKASELNPDLFLAQKQQHAETCLTIYKHCRTLILEHPKSFDLALYISLRSNWIDCVDNHADQFLPGFFDEVSELLDDQTDIEQQKLYNHYFQYSAVKEKLSSKQTILFECDNHGEIILDLIFIEKLLQQGHSVILACKSQPVLNDVTYDELKNLLKTDPFKSLHPYISSKQCRLIHTNSTIAGKFLGTASESYKKAFAESTLLILKGQGNFQTMPMGKKPLKTFVPYPYAKPIVYMFGMKAPFIRACFASVLGKNTPPLLQSPMLYLFDSKNPETYPK